MKKKTKNTRVWSGGFWGQDKSITVGGYNDLDEQFIITYRKLYPQIMVPSYDSWKKHFPSPVQETLRFENYKDAVRADWFYKEMHNRMADNRKRFPVNDGFGITEEDLVCKQEHYTKMAEWCEKMAKSLRNMGKNAKNS